MTRIAIFLATIVAATPSWGQMTIPENTQSYALFGALPLAAAARTGPQFLTIFASRGNIVISLGTIPMTVDLGGNTPDEAAKVFWNAVMIIAGRPPMFPEVKP